MVIPYPIRILSLILAAVIGGYLLTCGVVIFVSAILPITMFAESIVAASLFSFAIYTAAIIWVFASRNLTRAWLGMLIPALALTAIGMMITEFLR